MSPYSLTTKARRRRVRWNCASCCVSEVPSGTKYGLARRGDLDQPLAREGAARELLRDALHVQNADQVVELAVVHRQARVRCLAQRDRGCPPSSWRVSMAGDLLARNHDVIDHDALEIENRQQHLAVARRHQRAALGDHGAQLIGRERLGGAGRRGARRTVAEKPLRGLVRRPG